ncbi:PilZ domain-containing protein [Novosphingobium sp. PhB165]|uniref:PilZ domain-containing protein n=1 Tax=Novosphingobium sp. PhB165 TaxID=2485105 RepID=UPI00104D4CCA|nr:PilZ domain-containing protein [Novosphingobium sp. PhB165]TCM16982.1 PilZ domain-containing protein [Novosphingobium sp. PhB165]
MSEGENRQIARDSLFLMADLRVDGLDGECRIKVRNLSAGGMMGEGAVRVVRGSAVKVNIRNIGWVPGAIAWVQDNRFGVAFGTEIDPKLARVTVGAAEDATPRFVRTHEALYSPDTAAMRKI